MGTRRNYIIIGISNIILNLCNLLQNSKLFQSNSFEKRQFQIGYGNRLHEKRKANSKNDGNQQCSLCILPDSLGRIVLHRSPSYSNSGELGEYYHNFALGINCNCRTGPNTGLQRKILTRNQKDFKRSLYHS